MSLRRTGRWLDEKLARGLVACFVHSSNYLDLTNHEQTRKAIRMFSWDHRSDCNLLQRPDKVLAVQNVTNILALLVDMVRRNIIERKINEAIRRRRELA
jgi:hypothetical protein